MNGVNHASGYGLCTEAIVPVGGREWKLRPAAVDCGHESTLSDAVEMEVAKSVGFGRGRIFVLIAFSVLSAVGWAYALMASLARPEAGSTAESMEQLLRRPDEPSALAVAIVIGLIVAVAGAAAAMALRRHAD